jgi:hypothetical protein
LARAVSVHHRLEDHLHRNGTRIIKFFLHLSNEEQRKRFLKRIDEPGKNWKFSLANMAERKFWKQYMKAYEECLSATSTRNVPSYVVPADDKENARLIISQVVLDTLRDLKMAYPKPDVLPFSKTSAARENRAYGLNSVGLKRRGFSEERLRKLHHAYKVLLASKLNTSQALEKLRAEGEVGPDVEMLIRFVESSERGVIK